MALAFASGSGGGAGGTVKSVTAADTSVVVAGTATDPTIRTATLDVIAADHAAAADWSNNGHKITSLGNGSAAQDAAAFGQIPAALPPNGAAGGDLGSTYPNPTVTSGAHLGAATVPIASLADPTTGKVIGSASNAAAAVFPPGFEIGYDQITANVTITSTTEASGTTVITCAAHTFDGGPVVAHFFAPTISIGSAVAGQTMEVCLFEGATEKGALGEMEQPATTGSIALPFVGELRFTPTAAAHTYTVTAFKSSTGTTTVQAGVGGTAALVPAFIRFTKV